jgi:GrpB-like predicted nucleotidyltransferase (UPF0157 family)
MPTVLVVDYDPRWPEAFEELRAAIWSVVDDIALAVEHVGSTSVPGLAAKPVIDISVVVPIEAEILPSIERLATLGYVHQGNLGIDGREAFESPGGRPKHHLYACPSNSVALANHLAVRDYLRTHPETARDFILGILRAVGFSTARLDAIERANRRVV